jgi:hypothetical protein
MYMKMASSKVLIVFLFLFLLLLPTDVAFCMPGGNGAVNHSIIEVYRPLLAQLPAESNWTHLFAHFEELDEVLRTSRSGQLLSAPDAYELIQQLYPIQLKSLLDSVVITFGPNAPEITEQFTVISRQLVLRSNELLFTLEEIARWISFIRGIDISNQPLEVSFPTLVSGLNLSPEAERLCAVRILLGTEFLYLQYGRLFTLLHFVL